MRCAAPGSVGPAAQDEVGRPPHHRGVDADDTNGGTWEGCGPCTARDDVYTSSRKTRRHARGQKPARAVSRKERSEGKTRRVARARAVQRTSGEARGRI